MQWTIPASFAITILNNDDEFFAVENVPTSGYEISMESFETHLRKIYFLIVLRMNGTNRKRALKYLLWIRIFTFETYHKKVQSLIP